MVQLESLKEAQAVSAANVAVRVGRASRSFARGALVADSWCCSTSRHHRYSGEAHQIAGGHGELELLIDSLQPAKHGLSNSADGLAPTEGLLDPFADDLADAVIRMAGSTAVDRATAAEIRGGTKIFGFAARSETVSGQLSHPASEIAILA
jgi:hypothetical protein